MRKRQFLKSNPRRMILAGVFTLCIAGAPPVVASFGYIIFDPGNFGKNVEQVFALLAQIERAAEQLRQQRQMLAHLPASVLDALILSGLSLDSQLNGVFGEPQTDAPTIESQFDSRYPIEFPQAVPAWLDAMHPLWMDEKRQQLLVEDELVHHLQNEMSATEGRLTTLIEASNGIHANPAKRPGIVAVAQAHVELMGLASGEADKLLAIRAARARRETEDRALAQTESAYRNARRTHLLMNWNSPDQAESPAITNPFLGTSGSAKGSTP